MWLYPDRQALADNSASKLIVHLFTSGSERPSRTQRAKCHLLDRLTDGSYFLYHNVDFVVIIKQLIYCIGDTRFGLHN